MTTGKKGNEVEATSTAAQARILLFAPSQRPTERKGEWQITNFGRCRVTGRLGQRHADLLESVLYCAQDKRYVSDGGVELLVDPHKIRKTLSSAGYSLEQIKKLFAELRAAVVEIEADSMHGERIIGGLIDHVVPSRKTCFDPLSKRERPLWKIRLGVALVALHDNDLKLYYDPAPICRLGSGISQAVVRHIISHHQQPKGGWYVDTLLAAVGGDMSPKDKRNARAALRRDTDLLMGMGITLDGNKISRATNTRPVATNTRPVATNTRPV